MKNKFQFEDNAWEELDDFYGDDTEVIDVDEVEGAKSYEEGSRAYYGGVPIQYVDNIVLDLRDEQGIAHTCELIGRVDVEEKIYLAVHPVDDEDKSHLVLLRAWNNEQGNVEVANIDDPEEFKKVEEAVARLLYDDGFTDAE